MKRLFIIITVIVFAGIATWLILFNNPENPNKYYIVTGRADNFSLGDPVYVDDIISGFIREIRPVTDTTPHALITIELNNNINIPDQSTLQIRISDTTQKFISLGFKLVPSSGYLKSGDTLYVTYDKVYRALNKASIASAKPNVSSDTTRKDSISIDEPDRMNGIVFRVQILISEQKMPANSEEFKGVGNVSEYVQNSVFKYCTGHTGSLKEARQLRTAMVAKGFNDAFVVAFHNGERISIQKALSLKN